MSDDTKDAAVPYSTGASHTVSIDDLIHELQRLKETRGSHIRVCFYWCYSSEQGVLQL